MRVRVAYAACRGWSYGPDLSTFMTAFACTSPDMPALDPGICRRRQTEHEPCCGSRRLATESAISTLDARNTVEGQCEEMVNKMPHDIMSELHEPCAPQAATRIANARCIPADLHMAEFRLQKWSEGHRWKLQRDGMGPKLCA